MWTLRGIAVSLAFFVLVYSCLSALVVASWRGLRWLRANEKSLADLLFLLRVLPLLGSLIFTFAFVVPSFDILEPRTTNEGTGTLPLILGIAALLLVSLGTWRVITAQRRTSRVVARWLEGARPLETGCQTLTLRSRREAPPLTLVGMSRPRVLVSDSTLELLSHDELHIALQHELAHIRSYDNLKKLFFRFTPFPGMSKLESAWSQTAELAADDAAVRNAHEAVDLAAALVKLSRLIPVQATAEPAAVCTVGFVTGTISARVARLLAWDDSLQTRPHPIPRWFALPPIALFALGAAFTYGPVLDLTHQLTEWLVQ